MMKSIVLILLAQSDYLWLFDIVNLVKEENPQAHSINMYNLL